MESKIDRPVSITILGWLFIAVGTMGVLYHLSDFKTLRLPDYQPFLICFVRLLAILGGAFMLRGSNGSRWLVIFWLALHVVLSAFHSRFELVVHALFLVVITYLLFRPRASAYFRGTKPSPPQMPDNIPPVA